LSTTFPEKGLPESQIVSRLDEFQRKSHGDSNGVNHLITGLYHYTGIPDLKEIAGNALVRFMESNMVSPSEEGPHQMEREVISMISSLWSSNNGSGFMTSGGTESNITALWAARNRAKKKHGSVVLPTTAHPSFWKACNFLGLEPVAVPATVDHLADVDKMKRAIRDDTVAIVASCGTWPYATIDPIKQLAEIAEERSLHLHVDAAIGGLLCPWLKGIYDVPDFDFRVKGVSSISSDPHKMGFSVYPAGALVFRDDESLQYAHWESAEIGRKRGYHTYGMLGTRPGSSIAATWAVFNYLGREGYVRLSKKCMDVTYRFVNEVEAIPNFRAVTLKPKVNLASVSSQSLDMDKIKKNLRDAGWFFWDWRRVSTGGFKDENWIVFWASPYHENTISQFVEDMKKSATAAS